MDLIIFSYLFMIKLSRILNAMEIKWGWFPLAICHLSSDKMKK